MTEGPGGVTDCGSGAVGDDVGDLGGTFSAVSGVDVLDDLLAAAGLDIEVDVWVAGSPWGQEALEEHLVPDGVDGCDAQGVADCGVGRRASPLAQDSRLCAELDDGVHDEEVAGESQGLDDLELVGEHLPGSGVLLRGAVAAGGALAGELAQPAGRCVALRDIGVGEVGGDEGQVEGEVCGELGGQVDGAGTASVELRHVLGPSQPATDGGQVTAGAFQVGDQAGGGEHVGDAGVGGAGAAHCAGGHEGQPVVVGQPDQGVGEGGVGGASIQGELNGQADCDISFNLPVSGGRGAGTGGTAPVRGGKELGQAPQAGVCRLQVPGVGATWIAQGPTQGAVGGSGEDEAASRRCLGLAGGIGVEGRGECGQVVGWFSTLPCVQVVLGDGGHQAAVAGGVASQDRQVGAVGQGELGAVNGGQAVGTACLGVLDDAGDAVVIGQGKGLQTQLDGGRGQVVGLVGPVEEGVDRVGVELGITVSSGHDYWWRLER